MLSFEPELETLRPLLGPANTDALIARERRDVFSVHTELRAVAWGAAMLIATAAGIVLKNNFERIGPLGLALLMAVAAAACYAWVWRHRSRASLVDDSILLLGALLVSGDVAFIETQFHLFGTAWYRQFLVVAAMHAAGAYLYRSRTLLSMSIVAMAGWMGIERGSFDHLEATDFAMRAAACAALALMWRTADLAASGKRDFSATFEHFAANFLLSAGVALMFADATRIAGCLMTIVVAAAAIWWGVKTRRESFVLYSFLYAVLAMDVLLIDVVREPIFISLVIVVSSIGAIVALFIIHSRFQERRA